MFLVNFIKFILTINIFITLKIFELLKFFLWSPFLQLSAALVYMARNWKATLGALSVMSLLAGFLWLASYLSVPFIGVVLFLPLMIIIGMVIYMTYSVNRIAINSFFAKNWRQASKLTERVM